MDVVIVIVVVVLSGGIRQPTKSFSPRHITAVVKGQVLRRLAVSRVLTGGRRVGQHHSHTPVALQQLSGPHAHHPHHQLDDGGQDGQQEQHQSPVEERGQRHEMVVAGGERCVEGQSAGEEDTSDDSVAQRQREERVETTRHQRRTPRRSPDVQLAQTPPHVVTQLSTNTARVDDQCIANSDADIDTFTDISFSTL